MVLNYVYCDIIGFLRAQMKIQAIERSFMQLKEVENLLRQQMRKLLHKLILIDNPDSFPCH